MAETKTRRRSNSLDDAARKKRFEQLQKKGRVTQYEFYVEPYLEDIGTLAKCGWSDKRIAEHLTVSPSAFIQYKKKHQELFEALTEHRTKGISGILDSLVQRANGYDYEEKLVQATNDPGTQRITRQTTRITKKHVIPDTAAAKILLDVHPDADHFKRSDGFSIKEISEHTTRIYDLREEHGWNAARTAREFEKIGMKLPESLKMEVKHELEVQGADHLPTPVIKIMMDGSEDRLDA
jgi:L-rhamnose mutarotase